MTQPATSQPGTPPEKNQIDQNSQIITIRANAKGAAALKAFIVKQDDTVVISEVDIDELKRTAIRLTASESQFRSVFEYASEGLAVIDTQGTIQSVNPFFAAIFGYNTTELIGMCVEALIPHSSRKAHQTHRVNFMENPQVRTMGTGLDLLGLRKNGETFPIEVSLSYFENEDGVTYITALIIDITERKRAAEALKTSEEKFRVLYEEAPIMHVNVDANDATIKDCNRLLVERLGYTSKEDVIGQPIFTVYHEDCMADVEAAFNSFVNTGKVENAELTLKCKDGSKVPVILNVAAVHNDQGEIMYSSSSWVEITELKKTEAELKATQHQLFELTERFQIAAQAAQVGIWDWEIQTNTLLWDDIMYRLYGIQGDTFSGAYESWQAGLHPDDAERGDQEIQLALKGEKEFDTEFRVVWPDQSIRHIKAVAKVERNAAGEPIRMTGTNWDITPEKEAIEREEMRLKQMEVKNKELEQFAYIASHDLQEPLRTIISFGDQLKKDYQNKLDENANQYLYFMAQAATRMSELIKGILDYSRVGHSGQQTTIDCNALLKDIREDLALSLAETNTLLEIKTLPQVQGFETDLRMLFQNLITNAIKFRQKSIAPHITISAQPEKGHWKFTVQDNGIGIAPEHQDRVFKIFQRLHTRQDYEGTGIGLANCKKIVDLHHGEIWLESELNVGSTFYFTIRY